MPVDSVNNSIYLDSIKYGQTNKGQILGKDDFLLLLVTQMQYQDPLSPMDNTEYVAQLAQFSELETMQNISLAYAKSQAMSLVGKIVSVQVSNSEEAVGKVDMVTFDGADIYVTMGDLTFKIDQIKRVFESFDFETESPEVTGDSK